MIQHLKHFQFELVYQGNVMDVTNTIKYMLRLSKYYVQELN